MFEGEDTKAPRVLVTRPALDARHWVQSLQQNGFLAEALPLIEIAPLTTAADAEALEQVWHTIDSYSALMFVSSHAVSHFFGEKEAAAQSIRARLGACRALGIDSEKEPQRGQFLPDLQAHSPAMGQKAGEKWTAAALLQPMFPKSDRLLAIKDIATTVRFLAPGPGTATALRAAGVPQGQIDAPPPDAAQFDSDALWQVIGGQEGGRDWAGRRVLIVRGHGDGAVRTDSPGRDWLARQWIAAGATVDFLSVYERRTPQWSPAQISRAQNAAADGSVWLFSSSEAVANLGLQPGIKGIDWHQSRAIATHPRIAQAARAAGWGVVVESRPALDDIVMCLRSIESGCP